MTHNRGVLLAACGGLLAATLSGCGADDATQAQASQGPAGATGAGTSSGAPAASGTPGAGASEQSQASAEETPAEATPTARPRTTPPAQGTSVAQPPAAPEESGDPGNPDDGAASKPFGGSYTWNGGVSVQVKAPKKVTLSAGTLPSGYAAAMAVQVVVTNRSGSLASTEDLGLSALTGETEAPMVEDAAKGYAVRRVSLPNGKSTTFSVAFAVTKAGAPLTVMADWGFGSVPGMFR